MTAVVPPRSSLSCLVLGSAIPLPWSIKYQISRAKRGNFHIILKHISHIYKQHKGNSGKILTGCIINGDRISVALVPLSAAVT